MGRAPIFRISTRSIRPRPEAQVVGTTASRWGRRAHPRPFQPRKPRSQGRGQEPVTGFPAGQAFRSVIGGQHHPENGGRRGRLRGGGRSLVTVRQVRDTPIERAEGSVKRASIEELRPRRRRRPGQTIAAGWTPAADPHPAHARSEGGIGSTTPATFITTSRGRRGSVKTGRRAASPRQARWATTITAAGSTPCRARMANETWSPG